MFRTILIPTDFSPCSRRAIEVGLDLARRYDAHATLLHASAHIDRHSFVDAEVLGAVGQLIELEARRLEEAARREMEQLLAEAGGDRLPLAQIHQLVAFGEPSRLILATARDIDADLIVIGTHGRRGVKDHLLGSTAERVMRKARCHVLAVKPEGYPLLRD